MTNSGAAIAASISSPAAANDASASSAPAALIEPADRSGRSA
jgi:1-acyl-sn-glycerol-3-phosphate acyltransferase